MQAFCHIVAVITKWSTCAKIKYFFEDLLKFYLNVVTSRYNCAFHDNLNLWSIMAHKTSAVQTSIEAGNKIVFIIINSEIGLNYERHIE